MNHRELLKVYSFSEKIRLGSQNDGGYVIAEVGNDYDCYISAGVSGEESFSRDIINRYSFVKENNYAFDGTIEDYPYEYTKEINYIKKNIASVNDEKRTNLNFLFKRYNNIFCKMDIEGGEYEWLLSVKNKNLRKIKQLVIEFHGLTGNNWLCDYKGKIKCLKKLNDTHYVVHAHANNYGGISHGFPDVLEVTYLRKDLFPEKPSLNTTRLPIPGLDYPNHPHGFEINLNCYPFVFGDI